MKEYKEKKTGVIIYSIIGLIMLTSAMYYHMGFERIYGIIGVFLIEVVLCLLLIGSFSTVIKIYSDRLIIYNSISFWKKQKIFYYKDVKKVVTRDGLEDNSICVELYTQKRHTRTTGLDIIEIGNTLKEYGVTVEHYRQKGIHWVRDDDKK